MAKSHKLAWNGLDIQTALTVPELGELALAAAHESTGDLVFGMQRVSLVRSSDRRMEFRVNDFMLAYKKLLVFSVEFTERSNRTDLTSKIDWYLTERQNLGFLPVGAKQMIGHSTYLQFVHGLADKVRAADTTAEVTIREGDHPQSVPQIQADPVVVTRAVSQSKPVPSFAPVAPYLREDSPSYSPATPAEAPVDDNSTDMSGMPTQWPDPSELSSGRLYFGDLSGASAVTAPVSRPKDKAECPVSTEVPDPPAVDADAIDADPIDVAVEAKIPQPVVPADAKTKTKADPRWVLTMANGTVIAVEHPLVLGRNPQLPPEMPGAEAVVVTDPERSVSKTHVIVEARDGDLWVTDLASTNGTRMGYDPGEWIRCEPGVATKIVRRCQLRFGKYRLQANVSR